jgi:two-component sensor histidine kinase
MNYRWAVNVILRVRPWSVHALLVAFAAVGVAAVLRVIVAQLGATLFFATYTPAVLFAAVVAGVPGAVLVVLLTSAIAWWAYFPPAFEFNPLSATQIANLGTFWLSSALVIGLAHLYRKSLMSLLDSEAARELLIRELNHRAGNTLSVLQAIISGTVASDSDRQTIIARLQALARTNRLISETNDGTLRLSKLIQNETEPYANSDRVVAEGPEVQLDPETGRSVALVIHELATNASKYGALSNKKGKLHIDWFCKDGKCLLRWEEIDGPPVVPPTRTGFGTRMITASLLQISGTIESEFRTAGYSCLLTFGKALKATPEHCGWRESYSTFAPAEMG